MRERERRQFLLKSKSQRYQNTLTRLWGMLLDDSEMIFTWAANVQWLCWINFLLWFIRYLLVHRVDIFLSFFLYSLSFFIHQSTECGSWTCKRGKHFYFSHTHFTNCYHCLCLGMQSQSQSYTLPHCRYFFSLSALIDSVCFCSLLFHQVSTLFLRLSWNEVYRERA